jgi:hypothetical protein
MNCCRALNEYDSVIVTFNRIVLSQSSGFRNVLNSFRGGNLRLLWNDCKARGQYHCEASTSVVSLKALTFILRRYTFVITRDFYEINGVSSYIGTHQES